jgi:two-component system, NtrC family, sensor histidine kinase HydH
MIILIFLALAIIMVSSALFELHQSKQELYNLMEKQSHSLLESLIIASHNALKFNQSIEVTYQERLLNNANLIKVLYENNKISNQLLSDLAKQNHIFRINIFNRSGQKIYSSHIRSHTELPEKNSPKETLKPIFTGKLDTLFIRLKPARFEDGYRFVVAIAAYDRSAIVLNIDAEQMINQRKQTGFGALIREIVSNPGIVYIALQDTTSILAASGNVDELETVNQSKFLYNTLYDSVFQTRITQFDTLEVFEAVHPFIINSKPVGVIRLGLSLEPLRDINDRIYRRLSVITLVLIALGSLVFTFIFLRQKYQILEDQYHVVESYSGDIIKNVSDAILVFNEKSGIKIYNNEANHLFKLEENVAIGRMISEIIPDSVCSQILEMPSGMQQIECELDGEQKYLLISKSSFTDPDGQLNTILVIRDLTQQKRLENQIQLTERLSAMGELASGVAHEIRNPLNTIGTIVQQLDKDFKPSENQQEFHELAQVVYQEVRRIDRTINDFLRFSKPEPLNPEEFKIKELFEKLNKQYQALLKSNNINLNIHLTWDGLVFWDLNQIRQVLMNLMQNSIDVMQDSGNITININLDSPENIGIIFEDTGPGIDDDLKSKIFNLYFTTKAKGTGIGLSIVQRIISEHNGVISIINNKNGAAFKIILPIRLTMQG